MQSQRVDSGELEKDCILFSEVPRAFWKQYEQMFCSDYLSKPLPLLVKACLDNRPTPSKSLQVVRGRAAGHYSLKLLAGLESSPQFFSQLREIILK